MLPILYQSPDLIIYSYPLFMGLAWGIGYQIFFSNIPVSVSRLKAHIYFWGVFLSAWVGAKLLFSLTYPDSSHGNLLQYASFWTGGGFVFYGGLLGGMLFLGVMKLFDQKFSLTFLWPMVEALVLGHGIGRLGCFLAGCCFGEVTDSWWGVYMHDDYRHPTQLIEAVGLIAMGIYFIKSAAPRINLIITYLVGYGLLRLLVESLRGDVVRGEWGALTPSQWISLGLITSGFLLLGLKNKVFSR